MQHYNGTLTHIQRQYSHTHHTRAALTLKHTQRIRNAQADKTNSQCGCLAASLCVSQSVNCSVCQSVSRSVTLSVNHSITQSVSQSLNQRTLKSAALKRRHCQTIINKMESCLRIRHSQCVQAREKVINKICMHTHTHTNRTWHTQMATTCWHFR